ncbi:MAG TPA: hypothetical protein VM490_10160 [Armatimonadaceae bacterium]|nr:hypothetical protein [Armatimonadaceae bacterium]
MSLWNRLKSWLSEEDAAGSPLDGADPDVLLARAQREMQELHARNRERAVEAITRKNNLQERADYYQKRVDVLLLQAAQAENLGDVDSAERLRDEAAACEETLNQTLASLAEAVEVAETVKASIKSEEEAIRRRTAEALALKAQWKTVQVQRSLLESLVEINAGLEGATTPRQMQARHARNRRLVLQAIAQKNNLNVMLEDTEKRVHLLREKATLAQQRGDDELENSLLREMEQYEATLDGTRAALEKAVEVTERAKGLIHEEEARLRGLGLDTHSAPLDEADGDDAAARESGGATGGELQRRWRDASALGLAVLLLVLLLLFIFALV